MGARGDIISSGIPGLTSRAHRSPHKLALNSVCRLAPAPRQTISSILLFSSLGSSASSAGWKQICSSMGQDVALEEWLSPSICHGQCRCQLAESAALSPTAQTWGAALSSLEIPSLEIPSEKKNGSQGGFVHKMKRFCPFYR